MKFNVGDIVIFDPIEVDSTMHPILISKIGEQVTIVEVDRYDDNLPYRIKFKDEIVLSRWVGEEDIKAINKILAEWEI